MKRMTVFKVLLSENRSFRAQNILDSCNVMILVYIGGYGNDIEQLDIYIFLK